MDSNVAKLGLGGGGCECFRSKNAATKMKEDELHRFSCNLPSSFNNVSNFVVFSLDGSFTIPSKVNLRINVLRSVLGDFGGDVELIVTYEGCSISFSSLGLDPILFSNVSVA